MRFIKYFATYVLFAFFFIPLLLVGEEEIPYAVKFSGVTQESTLKLLNTVSQLIKLEKHPPKSEASLRRRAESDIPNLVKALHTEAFFNARVDYTIDFDQHPNVVIFIIDPGPVYPFGCFEVYPESLFITPKELGITLGSPAYTSDILAAEESLVYVLHSMGYPLAKLKDREIIADQSSKEIHVKLYADTGPLASFGDTIILGNSKVKEGFIRGKITWNRGDIYNPLKIDSTMNALEAAGVFSSIVITHSDEVNEEGTLTMTIQLTEGKQRSIGLGIGYSTQRGPGFTAGWEHRNYRGRGDKLRVNANILKDTQEGSVTYSIPDFLWRGQDLLYGLELNHNDTKGFEMTSFSLSTVIERQVSNRVRVSFGGMYEFLRSTEESKNANKKAETYNLARLPAKLRWTTVDDALDPTTGATVFLKTVPTMQLVHDPFIYTITSLTASIYKPLSKEKRLILAAKAMFASIWGASRDEIPGSDRLYAGSENTLRGYNYYTVSPLNKDGDPIGGRGLMIYSLEARWRITEKWGGVLFSDVGNVYTDPVPKFDAKMLKSLGIGVRYFTPVGPLRLDVALPLDRRKVYDKRRKEKRYVDSPYQIYFSVGQSF